MNDIIAWPVDEFVSLKLEENEKRGIFKITLEGDIKYSDIISVKIGDIRITKEELEEYVRKAR